MSVLPCKAILSLHVLTIGGDSFFKTVNQTYNNYSGSWRQAAILHPKID